MEKVSIVLEERTSVFKVTFVNLKLKIETDLTKKQNAQKIASNLTYVSFFLTFNKVHTLV